MPLSEDDTTIRLGDVFFVSFYPIFDIDNDQLGLAKSKRASEGTKITTSTDTVNKKYEDYIMDEDEDEDEDDYDSYNFNDEDIDYIAIVEDKFSGLDFKYIWV